jgi:nicotinamidase-related amidase
MIGLAPGALAAAAVVVVFSGGLSASAGEVLLARLLATAAAVMFAGGYGLVLWTRLRATDHLVVVGLTTITVSATIAAALITAGQLLFVDDTVALGIRVALWTLVSIAAIGTAILPVARWLMAR